MISKFEGKYKLTKSLTMPFSCIFKLNNGAIKETEEVVFLECIDAAFDDYKEDLTKIAKVLINGKQAFISTNCPCYISSKGQIESGERLTEKTKIGYFSAEGEDIPYNKPYAKIVYD